MPKHTLDQEDALFDNIETVSLDRDDEDDEEIGACLDSRERLDEGCLAYGSGSMLRLRPAGHGPDADESSAFDSY